ncbi:hypothetical protein PHYSODRAFT_296729 [Phytophthora sojae]|uniref:ATPase AAA-type core domain-containing protein n=1 Tax=Phytophthora sojae (strain P6497) TaxID=1094619 RepID=G4YS61_PHYSP|nr:hypothetical protein PHYSODRAFT_296729 [Phytophthora sojae]EGZ24762.1 hypothetical protein PHYSODRAFT_296729 [Phytophthora sojae]|eukprot:XP_009520050.1 hypothetical protein PHYSODRAFT_296729 [Phytophthora sojae]
MFRTLGTSSVDAFYRLMFPENASDRPLPVIFINAPPMSDKSAVCLQLYDKIVESKPKALLMRKKQCFGDLFLAHYGCSFKAFCAKKCDKVVFIDEAQLTYSDELLWRGFVTCAMGSKLPGLRFVMLASYGNFHDSRLEGRPGTPISIPPGNSFELNATPTGK